MISQGSSTPYDGKEMFLKFQLVFSVSQNETVDHSCHLQELFELSKL